MREENRSEIIHDALNFLDDETIEEVDELRKSISVAKDTTNQKETTVRKLFSWRRWAVLAASVCLVIGISSTWGSINSEEHSQLESDDRNDYNDSDMQESLPSDETINMENNEAENDSVGEGMIEPENNYPAVNIPAYQVNLAKNDDYASDMVGFFIYGGRCYVQTCDYMSKDVMGEYVCTTKGLIDEWTEKDGYVDLAGSISADVYTVAGVDSEFMLCIVYDDGVVETYIHNNGITLSRGNEILDWLGFDVGREEYAIFCSKGNSCDIAISEEEKEILDKFFANFGENRVVLRKDISITISEEEIYHLVIITEEGVPLHFMILNDGYVSYYGLQEVCVKIDKRVYDLLVDVLEQR